MSSRDKMSSDSRPKTRHRDKAPRTTNVRASEQSAPTGSPKVTNRRSTTTNKVEPIGSAGVGGGDKAHKSRISKKRFPANKQEPQATNSGDSRELVTTGRFSHEQELDSSNDAMNRPKTLEQETNIDDGDRGVNSQLEDTENDESSCLLSSDSQSDQTPVKLSRPGTATPTNASAISEKDDLNCAASSDTNSQKPLPAGWEEHSDKLGLYYWHVSTGIIQRTRPTSELHPRKESVLVCHDDEEINQVTLKTSDSDDDDDYYESGAALTLDDSSETTFVVYPLGCCEFDETQLVSATSTKTIQKCILRLCNMPTAEESVCWGLDQSQPILMKLHSDHIQFTDLKTRNLLRSQPINTIKTWAVDDDNNFAFVIEDRAQQSSPTLDPYESSVDYALLSEPRMMCYVFRSMDDDDMSCKVATKLNEEINRYKEQLTIRMAKSNQLQQMIEPLATNDTTTDQLTDTEEDFDCLETSNELTLSVKYIGCAQVPRPTGIDVLNAAIDKCLAEASNKAMQERGSSNSSATGENSRSGAAIERELNSTLIDAKLHVSPSSVIVENCSSGEIIVECRIRYLTFMGISRRDIRWCGFVMQNSTNKAFVAYCFECHPTAGPVCDAIQQSCTKMYEKVIKTSRRLPETRSIIPSKSKIRNTLAKTFARIKLTS